MQIKYLRILASIIVLLVVILSVIFWPKSSVNPVKVGQNVSSQATTVANFPKDQKDQKSEFIGFEKNEFGAFVPAKTKEAVSSNFVDSSLANSNLNSSAKNINPDSNANPNSTLTTNNPTIPKNDATKTVDVTESVNKIVDDFLRNIPKLPSTGFVPQPIVVQKLDDPIFNEPTDLPNIKVDGSTFGDTNSGVCGTRGIVSFGNFEKGFEAKIIKNSQLNKQQNTHLSEFVNGQTGVSKDGNNIDKIFKNSCTDEPIEFARDLGTIGTRFGNARVWVIKNEQYLAILQISDNWAMLTGSATDGDAILGVCGFENLVNLDETADMNNPDNSVGDNLDKCLEQNTNQTDIDNNIKTKLNEVLNLIN